MNLETMWDRIMESVDTKSIRSPAQLRSAAIVAVEMEQRAAKFQLRQSKDMDLLGDILTDSPVRTFPSRKKAQ